MLADFPMVVDHAQVLVGSESREISGLLWTDEHVAQGFAWADGFVSFGVPDHDGECRVLVETSHDAALDPSALWAVQVPFHVTGPLRIGTVFDARAVAVPDGRYNLIYQAFSGGSDHAYTLRLSFSLNAAPKFRILKKGGDVTADAVLRRDAEPSE